MIRTTASNLKVRAILKAVRDGSLVPQPDFQRRLVWTAKDKDRFIDTVLQGYPFPEIYLCDGEVDTTTGEGTQLLVDGLQRVSTLNEYFNGHSGFIYVLTSPYADLTQEEKGKFLETNVVVRDLGKLSEKQIIEVFRRLNSTQYTLREMEVNNAVYNGAMKRFCESIAEDQFFEDHRVFSALDRRRMGDVAFCVTLVGTLLYGYFNRDDMHEDVLANYNESFPMEDEYRSRIRTALDLLEECGFSEKSRLWKKADFLTTLVEIDQILELGLPLAPHSVLSCLEAFFNKVDAEVGQRTPVAEVYYKAALQASNDRLNRVRRGTVISGLLVGQEEDAIQQKLAADGLI